MMNQISILAGLYSHIDQSGMAANFLIKDDMIEFTSSICPSFAEYIERTHVRCSVLLDECLYIATPSNVIIFRKGDNGPELALTITRPDWILHGNIMDLYVDPEQGAIYVACAGLDAIDVFNRDGDFQERISLYDKLCSHLPVLSCPKDVTVGHLFIQRLFMIQQELFAVVGTLGDALAIVEVDSGRILIKGRPGVGDALWHNEQLYVLENDSPALNCYSYDGEKQLRKEWSVDVGGLLQLPTPAPLLARGMTCQGGVLYVALSLRGTGPKRYPATAILAISTKDGKLQNSLLMPEPEGIARPQVISLQAVSNDFIDFVGGAAGRIEGGKVLSPVDTRCPWLDGTEAECCSPLDGSECDKSSQIVTASPDVESVRFDNVGLRFVRKGGWLFGSGRKDRHFWALRNISFTAYEGECVGIIGRNGSGKSTIAMLLAGIYQPDEGDVHVRGEVNLLSLNAGLNSQLTGLENVQVKASYMGASFREISKKLDEIVAFADLEDFIGEPVRTYSNGMKARLGFAISTAFSPEILILDEVIATGDAIFRYRAEKRMKELLGRSKNVFIVSHQTSILREMCTKVIWLDKGQLIKTGLASEVLAEYDEYCKKY